jgi:hypothetical protein
MVYVEKHERAAGGVVAEVRFAGRRTRGSRESKRFRSQQRIAGSPPVEETPLLSPRGE